MTQWAIFFPRVSHHFHLCLCLEIIEAYCFDMALSKMFDIQILNNVEIWKLLSE